MVVHVRRLPEVGETPRATRKVAGENGGSTVGKSVRVEVWTFGSGEVGLWIEHCDVSDVE